ncbi:putative inorganic phosphate cotransporter isoform X2 [Agrilus planipennis]|uniref:Putative inorganic phosphate cotransporter n=1 Tax=Agrilus planipennis TaxID=224129 RepID=A0A1W4WMD3_AGRPL|nr:putative inorganic phosphate cotransporter isoform X2 [Agrilus planipennis]
MSLDGPANEPIRPQRREKSEGWWGTRHTVTFMLFLGMANAYIMRTNMSVAIVAMVNHTGLLMLNSNSTDNKTDTRHSTSLPDGNYVWESDVQGHILGSFFYGYVLTQIPVGILSKKYGAIKFLGYGMLINSIFGFLVPFAADWGYVWLIIVRFIQGLGEGPSVPCTHVLLSKWIPVEERSRMGSFAYAGAQFGTVIAMPISGWLSASLIGWPSIFYIFGAIGTLWSIAFLAITYEDPGCHPGIHPVERKYIQRSIWGTTHNLDITIPWMSIFTSLPFWAILIANSGHNYGYDMLMTELPTYMKQILHFNIQANGVLSALPYLAMWFLSVGMSYIADGLLRRGCSLTIVRKSFNTIGLFGPAIALFAAGYTGCYRWLTVSLLTIAMGLNGGIYSGFKVNHLDISPRFAGILMAFTNCAANVAGLLGPMITGYIIKGEPTEENWRIVFTTASLVYVISAIFFAIFASGIRQKWDSEDKVETTKTETVELSIKE